MTLTAPIPLVAHPPIHIEARVQRTAATDEWGTLLAAARNGIEIGVMRRLDSTPWSTIDGDIDWNLDPEPGKSYVTLSGTWRQR